jgi:hypothetical protein
MQMHRYGGSVSFDAVSAQGRRWSSLAVWSMNVHHHDGASHLLLHGGGNASPHQWSSSTLLETNRDVGNGSAIFGRAERVVKNGEELGFLGGDLTEQYVIHSLAVGAQRTVAHARGIPVSMGARLSAALLPESLRLSYGTLIPIGANVFVQVRRRSPE